MNILARSAGFSCPAMATTKLHRVQRLVLMALTVGAGPCLAQVNIDAFTDAVPQTAQPDNQVAALVIGGFRDVRSNIASNSATVDAGRFTCAGTTAFQGCTVQYDGDDDPTTFTPGGFAAPVDLTAGGQDRIDLATFVAAGVCNLQVQICDDDVVPQCESQSFAGISDGGMASVDFASFNPTLDLTQVTAMLVNLTPTAAPVDCAVGPLAAVPVTLQGFSVE